MKTLRILLALVAMLIALPATAATPSPAANREIAQLLGRLETSGCQFNRNGTWYSAVQAREHLNGKYDYLLDKGRITDAESFIRLAATESSVSGKRYQVKCKDGIAQESASWLSAELIRLRKEGAR